MRFPDTIADTARRAYRDLLAAESRTVAGRVKVLDSNEVDLGVELPIVSGSVDVDATADVTRAADVVALDLDDDLGFEAGSPWAGAVFADKLVQIDYGVVDPADGQTHWTPLFRGPIVSYERARPEVRFTAQGKESLTLAPSLPFFRGDSLSVPRGTAVDVAVRRIALACGESASNLNLPNASARTERRVELGRTTEPWRAIRAIAKDAGMVAFYDGAGRLTLRRKQATEVITFDSDLLTTWPRMTYDLGSDFRNTILVVGEATGKQDRRPVKWAMAGPSDPLGPNRLARNGKPRYIAEYIKVDATSGPKCQRIADEEYARRMRQAVSVDFDALPVPGLEEWDPARVQPPGEDPYPFVLTQFGYDLGPGSMSVGVTRSVRVPRIATR
jgi:hypothetical protein